MKKLYFLVLLSLLGSEHLWAQTTDSLRLKLDYVFAHLDKSQVPTGLLDAYATPLVPLAPFNGQLADSTRTTPAVFRALYATAYTSCINGTNPLRTLPSFNASVASAEAAAGPTVIPVMVERIDYATVRQDAFSQNLLSLQNQQVYDVAGRPASPYSTQTLFAAAPAREYAVTGNVALQFQQSLFAELNTAPLFNLQGQAVDFGDGRGYLAAAWGQPVQATYTTSGTKRIKVRFIYQRPALIRGGKPTTVSYESQFDLFVAAPAASTARTTADPFIQFDAMPGRAAGKAYIHYATNNTSQTLIKPLIVAEGFDRSFIAPHTAVNYSIEDFLREIKTSPDASAFNFRGALENVGNYDIVFIDYANGTDDILLNAGLFKAVLDYVNQNKDHTVNAPNVVMGMSMGGLIARYKLAEMEKTSPGSTQTKLLILQDSPQRGANIPLGLSALTRQAQLNLGSYTAGDVDVILQEANTLLDQPATKQLLLYQTKLTPHTLPSGFYYNSIDFAANTFVDGPYRAMVDYQAPYRIVAVSQGSQCGVGLFAPYTELIRGSGRLNLFNLPFIFVGSGNLSGQVLVNAIPANGQANRVSGLNAIWNLQLFFGRLIIKTDFVRANFECPAGLLPVDGAAGGTEPIGDAVGRSGGIVGSNLKKGPFWFPYLGIYSLAPKFCFIPTPSGLDIADFTATTLAGSYISGVASTSTSRTDGFLAQEQFTQGSSSQFNQPHLTFTARNGEWIFDQMQNKPADAAQVACSAECTALAISSSLSTNQRLCPGTSAAFSTNAPAGATISWSATPTNLFTVTSGSGPSFTTSASGTFGTGTVTATITVAGTCPSSASTTVLVGTGEPTGIYSSPGGYNLTLHTVNYVAPGEIRLTMDQPYNFTFTSSDPANVNVYGGGQLAGFALRAGQGVTIRVTSPSGSSCGLAGRFVFTTNSGGYRLTATPNPASSDLVVTAVDEDQPETSTTPSATAPPFEVELYDNRGKKVKAGKSNKGKARVDVRELPAGLYNVRAGQGKEAISKHIELTR